MNDKPQDINEGTKATELPGSSKVSPFTTYLILGSLLTSAVVIFLFTINNKIQIQPPIFEKEVLKVLSTEEVNSKRSDILFDQTQPVVLENTNISTAEIIKSNTQLKAVASSGEATQNSTITPSQNKDLEVVEISKDDASTENSLPEPISRPVEESKATVTLNSPSVTFGEVTISSPDDGLPSEARTVTGTVFSVNNNQNNEFIIIGDNGNFKVQVNNATEFYIKNSRFDYSNLKPNDTVEITGTGVPSSENILAETVTVTAVFKPTISF